MTSFQKAVTRHWHDAVNLLLGVWLVASPWILGYAAAGAAAWNAYVIGVVIAVAAVAALVAFHEWEEWVNGVLGVWLIISPWLLGFGALNAAIWNQIVVGVLVAGLAIWSVIAERQQTHAEARG